MYYHHTRAENLPSILKRGLLPRTQSGRWHSSLGPMTFLDEDLERAQEKAAWTGHILLEIDEDSLDPEELLIEPRGGWTYYTKKIPPSAIRKISVPREVATRIKEYSHKIRREAGFE